MLRLFFSCCLFVLVGCTSTPEPQSDTVQLFTDLGISSEQENQTRADPLTQTNLAPIQKPEATINDALTVTKLEDKPPVKTKIILDNTTEQEPVNDNTLNPLAQGLELKRLCVEPFVLLQSTKQLTELIDVCGFDLDGIQRINRIDDIDAVDLQRPITLPTAVYRRDVHASGVPLTHDKILCSSLYTTVRPGQSLSSIAWQCGWGADYLQWLNGIKSQSDLYLDQTILLPPLVKKLHRRYAKQIKNIKPDRVIEIKENAPNNILAYPSFCYSKAVITPQNTTIRNLAVQCGFSLKYWARLNELSTKARLKKGQILLTQHSMRKQVTKKRFKKPFSRNNCVKSSHIIRRGENLGKIAVACQWDYRKLLLLNRLPLQHVLHVGQKVVFPSVLINRTSKNSVNKQVVVKTRTFRQFKKTDCLRTVWRVFDDTHLAKISATCQVPLHYLNRLNNLARNEKPKVGSALLLPTSLTKVRARYRLEGNQLGVPAHLCEERSAVLPAGISINQVANACGWLVQYVLLMNDLNFGEPIATNRELLLPSALYVGFTPTSDWGSPLKHITTFTIEEGRTKVYGVSGTTVQSSQRGRVKAVIHDAVNKSYRVVVYHHDKLNSVYADLASVSVKKNDVVDAGDSLGTLSQSKNAYVTFYIEDEGRDATQRYIDF